MPRCERSDQCCPIYRTGVELPCKFRVRKLLLTTVESRWARLFFLRAFIILATTRCVNGTRVIHLSNRTESEGIEYRCRAIRRLVLPSESHSHRSAHFSEISADEQLEE